MRRVATVAATAVGLGYPFAIYASLKQGAGLTPWVLLALAGLNAALAWHTRRAKPSWKALMWPAMMGLVALVSLLSSREKLVLFLPPLVSGLLFVVFAATLRSERAMLERFARLQQPEVSPAERAHCRQFTVIWLVFFAQNGTLAAVLALFAPLDWWLAYTGAISYVLIGVMFSIEYVIRRARFGGFGKLPHDRFLAWALRNDSTDEAKRA